MNARQAVLAALFNIGFGLVAVAFTVMATRRLGIADASDALVAWNVLMILGAVTQQPAEIYAPRLAFELRSGQAESSELQRAIAAIVAVGTMSSLVAVLSWGLVMREGMSWFPGPVTAVVGFGVLYVHRARLVALGHFGHLTITATATGGLALTVSLVAVSAELGSRTSDVLLLTTVAFIVPLVAEVMTWRSSRWRRPAGGKQLIPISRRSMIATTLSLGATSAVSLLFFAGGPPVGSLLGIDAESLTSYAVTSSLAAVPFIMLASSMLPLLNRSVELVEKGQSERLIPTLITAISLGFGAVVIVSTAGALFGPFALDAYIGGGFVLDRAEIVAVFAAAGSAAISNIPRLMITAIGRAPSFNRWLLATVVVYMLAILVLSGVPTVWRITGATVLAAGSLTVAGSLSIARTIRASGRSIREEPSTA